MNRVVKQRKISSAGILVLLILVLIVLGWTVPTLGIFVTSFRDSRDIYASGWWTVLPHKDYVKTGEFELLNDLDPNRPIEIEGHTASFEEWRKGIELEGGRILRWYGNKRSRKIEVYEEKWIGFGANLTLQNYKDVLSAGTVEYTDATGNIISRQGNNFGDAVLNSIAVTLPATIIPSSSPPLLPTPSPGWNFQEGVPYSSSSWPCWWFPCSSPLFPSCGILPDGA